MRCRTEHHAEGLVWAGLSPQHRVEFIEQRGQFFTEAVVHFAQAAALVEWRVGEIGGLDAEAGGDGVADEIEPGAMD